MKSVQRIEESQSVRRMVRVRARKYISEKNAIQREMHLKGGAFKNQLLQKPSS